MSEHERIERLRSEYVPAIPARRKQNSRTRKRFKPLRTWNNIPEFLRDNEFIRGGYRVDWSFLDTSKSLFQLHNETFNIWTHLLGFFVFVGLTIYIANMPPAPLYHPRESLENFWVSVQGNIHAFGDHIGDSVHSLHDSFDIQIGLLHGALQESLTVVQSHLHENLEHARETFHVSMDPLRTNLQRSIRVLSERLFVIQNNLGNMAGSVNNKLSTVRSNLEKSFNSVEDSLHNLRHDLTGNIEAAKTRVKGSLLSLQESVNGLQNLLIDTRSRQSTISFNNTNTDLEQCQTLESLQTVNDFQTSGDGVVRWPVFLYTTGVMICLFISSICHLFACCSVHANYYMWKLDYAGISVLIVTSFFPPVYYGFICEPHWVFIYLICTTVLGIGTVSVSLVGYLQKAKFRGFRASMFAALGLFGIVPWTHQILINFHEPIVRTVIIYELVMAACYLGGATLFVTRIPERFKPGAFDIMFHSHQFFHIFVVAGAYVHFQAVKDLMEWRESTNGCPTM